MARDPCKFCRENMVKTISKWQCKENTVSWKHSVTGRIELSYGSISTTVEFVVSIVVKMFMALGIAKLPEQGKQLPTRSNR